MSKADSVHQELQELIEIEHTLVELLEVLPHHVAMRVLGTLVTVYFADHQEGFAEWVQMVVHGVTIGPVGDPFRNNPQGPQ
jgi:hypothetical protein